MPQGFSQVSICNMALSYIGSKAVLQSIDESNAPAKACKRWYEASRLLTLEAFNWSFARKSLTLAAHSVAAPTNRWAYRYQYPSDCLSARFIENPLGVHEDAIPFMVEEADDDSKSIVTNMEDAVLIYTRDLSTVTRFSMHFIDAMSLQLAIKIIAELSGKMSRRDRLQREFQDMIIRAPVVDTEESVPRSDRDASWIRARA